MPQNGQTHSNNSSAICQQIVSVFDHFVGLALKGLSFEVDGMVQNNKKMNISRVVHHFP